MYIPFMRAIQGKMTSATGTAALNDIKITSVKFRNAAYSSVATQVLGGVLVAAVPVLTRAAPSYTMPMQNALIVISTMKLSLLSLSSSDFVHAPRLVRVLHAVLNSGPKSSVDASVAHSGPRVMPADRRIATLASEGASFLVVRDGQSAPIDGHQLEREVGQDAEIVFDNDQGMSVLAMEVVSVSKSDVMLASVSEPGRVAQVQEWLLFSFMASDWNASTPQGLAKSMLRICFALGTLCSTGVVLTSTGISSLVAITSFLLALFWLAIGSAFLTRGVTRRLVGTYWFRWRVFSILLANVALGVALSDARSLLAVSNTMLLLTVFASDGLVEQLQSQRMFNALLALVNALLVAVLIVADLVPASKLIWTLSSSFDYSLIQLVRDMYLGQIIILLFEVGALYRGAHHRRFLHIGADVGFSILPMGQNPPRRRSKHIFNAGVSKVQLDHSGFFVREPTVNIGSQFVPEEGHSVRRVFVNTVELQQADSLAVHFLGFSSGKILFEFMVSRRGVLAIALMNLFEWIVVLSMPAQKAGVFPSWFPLLSVVPTLALLVMHGILTSRTLSILLVRRRQFVVAITFYLIWFGLICSVLQDERVAIAVFVFECSVLDLLSDAYLIIPDNRGRFSRVWEKMNSGLLLTTLSAFMVFGVINTRQLIVVTRPDLVGNGTAVNSDLPFVVDTFQSTVDLQLSFALEKLLGVVLFVYRRQPWTFQVVKRPILPKFVL